jgi:hypothetical protein
MSTLAASGYIDDERNKACQARMCITLLYRESSPRVEIVEFHIPSMGAALMSSHPMEIVACQAPEHLQILTNWVKAMRIDTKSVGQNLHQEPSVTWNNIYV